MDSIQVYRAHIVELRSKLSDKLFQIWRGEFRRGRRRERSALQFFATPGLRAHNFFERCLVWRELAKIDMIAAGNVPDNIVDVHLQLGFAHLSLCAALLQFT